MEKLKILELFAGIGACSTALKRIGVDLEIVDAVEIDKYAIASFNAIHGTAFEPQDITLWDKDLKVDIITHGSPCFVAGTKVITDKDYKNIEDIRIGDKVLTHNNRYKTVIDIGSKESDDIYKIKAQGMFDTFVTGNHPYYVRTMSRQWNNTIRRDERVFSEPKWKTVETLTKNDFIGINIPNIEENPYDLDEETCWLLGRYVADGHIKYEKRKHRTNSYQYGIVYSIGNEKIEEFKNHLKKYHATIYPHTKSCYRAIINSKDLVEFIINNNFGRSAIKKNIPMFILNLPKYLAKQFLDGYMSGDGCFTNNKFKATSISKNLIMKLQLLIAKIYNTSSNVNFCKRPKTTMIEGRLVNQNDTYSITFSKETCKQNHSFIENEIVWYPIKEIEKQDIITTVYNMTVEDDNSYTANNFIVHNCQDFSVAGKQAGGDEGSGTRSSLLYETLRIVEKLKPKYVLWENVKNILSKKHRHNFDKYLEKMEELGYTNYYKVLNAKDYGIPQNRERVFTVSIKEDNNFIFPNREKLDKLPIDYIETNVDNRYFLTEKNLKHYQRNFGSKGKEIDLLKPIPTLTASMGNGGGNVPYFEFPKPEELKIRLKDILEDKVDEKYYLKDYQIENIKKSNFTVNKRRIQQKDYCDTLCARDWKDPKCVQVGELDIKEHDCIKRIYSDKGISPTLTDMQGGNRQPKIVELPCIGASRGRNPDNPSSRVAGEPTEQRLEINTQGTSNCLTSVQKDNYVLENKFRIRKLTPHECWRLMGFSDEDFEKAKAVPTSNTQLYKQAGNSIVVNVLEKIFKNLL